MRSFENERFTDDRRRIRFGLQKLKRPEMDEFAGLQRWIHSKEMEGDIRMVMDLIRLDTEAHMVNLAKDRERIV